MLQYRVGRFREATGEIGWMIEANNNTIENALNETLTVYYCDIVLFIKKRFFWCIVSQCKVHTRNNNRRGVEELDTCVGNHKVTILICFGLLLNLFRVCNLKVHRVKRVSTPLTFNRLDHEAPRISDMREQ